MRVFKREVEHNSGNLANFAKMNFVPSMRLPADLGYSFLIAPRANKVVIKTPLY